MRWRTPLVVLGLLAVLLAGCAHPVGPARTYGTYEGKARTTIEGALSAVQTVRLAAKTAADGNAFGPYIGLIVSEQEGAIDKLSGTFGSIQPPDGRADDLRSQVSQLLNDAVDHVADVRIAARRGEMQDLGRVAAPLNDDVGKLRRFLDEHP